MGDMTAEDVAGAILGEEPETTEQAEETTTEETAAEETVPATTEEETTTTEEVEEPEEVKVPLKALQEERRKRQALEAQLKAAENKPKGQETIEDMFIRDPAGTLTSINAEIKRLAEEDPYGNAAQIETLRDLKTDLRERGQSHQQAQAQEFVKELNTIIPDFMSKQRALTKFAVEELGYDMDELSESTNPQVVGKRSALATIRVIAKQYEKATAAKTVKQKEVATKPTAVEAPGTGAKPSAESIDRLMEEARETGDWSKYLDARGLLD